MARTAYVKELTKNLGRGTTTLKVRLRYETVNQTGKQDVAAFTVRTMLDYTTAPFDGFSASVQLIDVAHAGNAYNSLRNGDGQQRQWQLWVPNAAGHQTRLQRLGRDFCDHAKWDLSVGYPLTSYLKTTVGCADYHAEGFGLITRAA